jgi:hypothetical protein
MARHIYSILRVLFALFLTCAYGYGILESKDYMELAKYFPLYISTVFFALSIVQLILEVRVARGATVKSGPKKVDLSSDWEIPMNQVLTKALFYFGYFVFFYILIYLVGLRLSAAIGLFLVYRFQNRFSVSKSLVVSLSGWLFLIVIARVLTVKIPRGLLHEFVDLPLRFF